MVAVSHRLRHPAGSQPPPSGGKADKIDIRNHYIFFLNQWWLVKGDASWHRTIADAIKNRDFVGVNRDRQDE